MHHLTYLSLALKRSGLETIVISTEKEQVPGLKTKIRKSGIALYECKYVDGTSPWAIYQGAREISKIITKEGIDTVHANGVGHAIKAALARSLFKQKITIIEGVHTYAHGLPQKRAWLLKQSPRLMNLCADIITPCSEIIGGKLIKSGLSPGKTVPVHNGIDLNQFDAEISIGGSESVRSLAEEISGKPSIIYPAVLVPRKGHRYLLEAATMVLKEYPEARFIITSDGPLRSELEKMASDLDIAGSVIFTGRLSYEDLHWLLSQATIGVFPSLAELLPMAVLDLMAAAKPVVATNVDGIPEMVIDGKTGFLVPPQDSGTLAERIIELIRYPEKARQMGTAGRKFVEENFAIDIIARKTEEVYQMAVARANSRNSGKCS
jgi:glycosyltransferase involved in cell wall biosynthesis